MKRLPSVLLGTSVIVISTPFVVSGILFAVCYNAFMAGITIWNIMVVDLEAELKVKK